jgi:hypothetical protein
MTEELKLLPPPEKKIAAKVLYHMGWASRKIESWLGISDDTVRRAAEVPTPEELRQFEAEFTLAINEIKKEGLALTINQIMKVLQREKRIDSLVRVAEYFEGKNKSVINQQFNVNSEDNKNAIVFVNFNHDSESK